MANAQQADRAGALRVALFGECMLELQGEAFGTMRQTFGGDTLNTAVYLARSAGAAVQATYATGLGEDRLSDGLVQRWQAEGLGVELVRRVPGRMPGLYLIEVDGNGERTFSYWRDQSAAKAYFDVPSTPLEDAADELDALYVSGISLAILPPAGRERLVMLMARMRERGALVAFDNNFRPRLWTGRAEAQQWYARAYDACSLALITADDEQALHALPTLEAAVTHALALPVPEVAVKRGALGTLVRAEGVPVQEVPTQHVQPVDTTAAGDSFAGAYLAARLAGLPAPEAARRGNALAGRVIQHRGALIPRDAMADLMPADR